MANFFRPKSYAMIIDPSLKYAWVNIPKCASSFVATALHNIGWTDVPEDLIDPILSANSVEKLAIFRDPVERWISGLAQTGADRNWKVADMLDNITFSTLLETNPVFDDHTEFQHRFVNGAVNLKYIYLDPNRVQDFYISLTHWIRHAGGDVDFTGYRDPVNPKYNNDKKLAIHNALSVKYINSNNPIMEKQHRLDYELLEKYDKFTH